MFHSSCLYGRGVSAKYDVLFHIFLIGFDEESILHITPWFCGYTRYYTTAVWVGYDIPRKMPGIYGSTRCV